MTGIYQIKNLINGKRYIGQSLDIKKRWRDHIYCSKHNKDENMYIYNAIKKYGINNFEFSIIEECQPEELNIKEKYWIQYYHTYKYDPQCWGYNLTLGGNDHDNLKFPIDQYDLYGNFITTFSSISEAAQLTDTNMSNLIASLKGRQQFCNNFQWRYSGEKAPGPIINTVKDNHFWSSSKKKIDQYNKNNEYLATYDSAHEAARAINKKCANHITECCLGKRKSAAGFIWQYHTEEN